MIFLGKAPDNIMVYFSVIFINGRREIEEADAVIEELYRKIWNFGEDLDNRGQSLDEVEKGREEKK